MGQAHEPGQAMQRTHLLLVAPCKSGLLGTRIEAPKSAGGRGRVGTIIDGASDIHGLTATTRLEKESKCRSPPLSFDGRWVCQRH
jgi:hypothetical protein